MIEDNPADITLIRSALLQHGLAERIVVIRDGERALQYASEVDAQREVLPGLVILDLNLPRIHGWDVLRRFLSTGLAQVPIVILTSSDDAKDRRAAAELGARRYIKKPMRLTEYMEIGRVIADTLRETEDPHREGPLSE